MQIVSVSVTCYDVNRGGGKHPQMHLLMAVILMFSNASNLRSLQATYLKFAEYVDILVQVIYVKFKIVGVLAIAY